MGLTNVAKTPPKGWNSWDCYGASVTEKEVIANAEYMEKHLKSHGWEYVVVDIQWYEPAAKSSLYNAFYPLEMDEYSRLMPAINRFPSAKDGHGFKPLAQRIHGMGLKFGIHIMRGIPRQAVHRNTPLSGTSKRARDIAHSNSICPWNTDMYGVDTGKEGAQIYYNSLFDLYASWGVDYVKVDDIASSRLYRFHQSEIEMIRKAVDQCGRDMVLSLSPGPAPLEHADILKNNANMWRITDDFWDTWDYLYPMFERCDQWAEHVSPGNWPDCDMLPLGHIGIRSVDGGAADRVTRFTKNEQLTMMTLWSIFRSPLIFGGELCDNDEWTLRLLTHPELSRMHLTVINPHQVSRKDELITWVASTENSICYAAVFNVGKGDKITVIDPGSLGMEPEKDILDVWKDRKVGKMERVHVEEHGVVLLKGYRAS